MADRLDYEKRVKTLVLGRLDYYRVSLGMLVGMRGVSLQGAEVEVLVAMLHFGGGEMTRHARGILRGRKMSASSISNRVTSLIKKGLLLERVNGKNMKINPFYLIARDGMDYEIKLRVKI